MSNQYSSLNELLQQQLLVARELDHQTLAASMAGVMMEVPDTGKALSSAYEQLRNAAEHAEEHLLLQRAIKRFYKRNLFLAKRRSRALGAELIVELIHAGYLRSGGFSTATAEQLDQLVEEYLTAFGHLRQAHVERNTAMNWVLALISSKAENMLSSHHAQQATVFFAYHYFMRTIGKDQFVDLPESANYEFCLYIAVHQALLKSDIDIVRYELLVLYKQSPLDIAGFQHLNEQIDQLFNSPLTIQLKRVIGRYGAPFRILKSLVDDRSDIADILPHQQLFMDAYDRQIAHEYKQVRQRLNRRLIKSIAFIFITKVLVGLAIEVPYDIVMHGHIAFIPLGVNLLFPPLYMASLKLSLRPPSSANAQTVRSYIEKLLYDDGDSLIQMPARRTSSIIAKFIYCLLFMVPIAITVFILWKIGFNVVQLGIFFVFFSTASFLAFRLTTLVRELELTTRPVGLLASLRDLFYLPFILVGQWLSRKYSKVNAVGHFLDVGIELPLKTVLRLLRQWIRFLNEKHEELY